MVSYVKGEKCKLLLQIIEGYSSSSHILKASRLKGYQMSGTVCLESFSIRNM